MRANLSAMRMITSLCLCCFCLTGCSSESRRSASKDRIINGLFVGQPTIRANPIERVPLVAIIDFESPVDVIPSLEISDGDRQWEQPWPVVPAKKHRIAVMGMRPDREHTIRVRADTPGGGQSQLSDPLKFTTPPLPKNFPPLEIVRADPEKMEPGITLFAANIWRESVSILDYGYIVAVDNEGEVVWFCHTNDRIADMRILKNGHILYQHGNYRYAYEIDIMGRDINRWVATNLTMSPSKDSIPIKIDTLHHDLMELPNGNFMTLATEIHEFDNYPTSEFDADAPTAPAHVVCDAVIEFDAETGKIVERFHLKDILDPNRIGYISLGSFWKDKYNDFIGATSRDWSHANAIVYLPNEDAMIISFRHLDCIFKLDWKTKEIKWIFGDPDGWGEKWQKYLLKPKGDFKWTYHQHSPQVTPRGTIMLYDNGNYRARPFNKATMAVDNRSRILEFKIDEEAMTVETVFEYDGGTEESFYSPFYCEADWMSKTKNILVTDGGHIETEDGTPHDDVPGERQWARLFEITRDSPPEKVFEVRLDSGLGSPFGWSVYRATRLRNLYQGFRIAPPSETEDILLFDRSRHIKRINESIN